MTAPESPAVLLRRAADRLDELDQAATPGPWMREEYESDPGEWSLGTNLLAPNTQDDMDRGADALQDIGDMVKHGDAALVAALRQVSAPLAAWLRRASDQSASGNGIPVGRGLWLERALSVARAVLGETDGGDA